MSSKIKKTLSPCNPKLEGESQAPVPWCIPPRDYFMESTGDGLPIFHHNDYFTLKAIAAGRGSIAWYIECTESKNRSRPCPVKGVRHKDGRLLMLRAHNHYKKTPNKRLIKLSTPTSGNVSDSSISSTKSTPTNKSSVLQSPKSMPEAIRDRWKSLTTPKIRLDPSDVSTSCPSDDEVYFYPQKKRRQ